MVDAMKARMGAFEEVMVGDLHIGWRKNLIELSAPNEDG